MQTEGEEDVPVYGEGGEVVGYKENIAKKHTHVRRPWCYFKICGSKLIAIRSQLYFQTYYTGCRTLL